MKRLSKRGLVAGDAHSISTTSCAGERRRRALLLTSRLTDLDHPETAGESC